jgi:hypothetical protein
MKEVVDLVPERTSCKRALVFAMSITVNTRVKIKILSEPKFILIFFSFYARFNKFF